MIDEVDEIVWRELFADLSEAAGVALRPPQAPGMEHVRRARNVVLRLAEMLDNGSQPPFGLMLQAVDAAYVIGKYCVVTPPVEKFIADERAAHARWERSQTPEEIALREAIKAEYEAQGVDLAHPYAAAETLCDGVNVKLEAAAAKAEMWKFKPMKSKALGDRLKKTPR